MLFKILKLLLTLCKEKCACKYVVNIKSDKYFKAADLHVGNGVSRSVAPGLIKIWMYDLGATCTYSVPFVLRSCNLRRTKNCPSFGPINPFLSNLEFWLRSETWDFAEY